MQPTLQNQLARQNIQFKCNPPGAPHFGGLWEREIRSLKSALNVTLGVQHVAEEVLSTVLTEIEGILNSKPLGYVSSDIADVEPITPNSLLLGRPDPDLPQIVYPNQNYLAGNAGDTARSLPTIFGHTTSRDTYPNCKREISG